VPFFSDTFTAGANENLEAHTPDLGTSWTELWATTSGTGWRVNSVVDELVQVQAAATGAIYTADTPYPSAHYGVTVTLTLLVPVANLPVYLFLRIQDVANLYAARVKYGSGTCSLYKKLHGVWTALGSRFDSPASGSVLRLEMTDADLEFYDDGILIASAYDADIVGAGKAGLGCGGGAELVTSADGTHGFNRLDNFSVNSLRDRSRILIPSRLPTRIRGTPSMSLGGEYGRLP